jgi:hypothetical protein|tara:strand:- start:279 stop:398 length:120 start_codon:yes stop_codon:yes gene_type:complete
MSDIVMPILGLVLGWFLIGSGLAFFLAFVFFGIEEVEEE